MSESEESSSAVDGAEELAQSSESEEIEPEHPGPPNPNRSAATAWEDLQPALAMCFLLIATNVILLTTADQNGDIPLWNEVVVLAFDAILIIGFAMQERVKVGRFLRLAVPSGKTIGLSTLLLLGVGAVQEAYFFVVSQIAATFEYLEPYREQGWPLWSAFLMIAVYPALFEELAFRGFLQERLARVMKGSDALILQAMLFSVLHLSPLMLPSLFVIGYAFGWLRQRTGSLWPGVVLHGLWNSWCLVGELRATPWE